MVVPKICGIETEYGIIVRGAEGTNPVSASSTLVNAYVESLARSDAPSQPPPVRWDFEDESPGNDARGHVTRATYAPEVETHLVNAVLVNGSRYYVDHAHPELATPECRTALDVLRYDLAGEQILIESMAQARGWLAPDLEIVVYKNNSDGKGQSYGCHENYLLDRSLPFGQLVTAATAHFVSRAIYCGAGKVGAESPGGRADDECFQITQRADFFEEPVGLETTLRRPIVNTRDEPHADATRFRRLHVIIGDANMSEIATLLKVGTTALWFAAVEAGRADRTFTFADPVAAFRAVSRDLSLAVPLQLDDGSTITALDLQWELLRMCTEHAELDGLDAVGADVGDEVLQRWEYVLNTLEADPMRLADQVDWIAKYRLVSAYRDRHHLPWGDARLRAMDLQYHDLRPQRSLARRIGLATRIDPADVAVAVRRPPIDTRAWFRGECLRRFADQIVSANWDSLVFDTGAKSLQRVPMMDPSKGTRDQVGALLDGCADSAELVAALRA